MQRSVINLSGLEYNGYTNTARPYYDYVPPSDATIAAVKAAGFWGVRLPASMERLQPDPDQAVQGKLVTAQAELHLSTVRRITAAGLAVIFDLHNYGQYWGNDIDMPDIRPMYLGIVTAVAKLLTSEAWGLQLGSEPKNLDPARLEPLMQAATDAARKVGYRGTLFVPTAWWSNAKDGINITVRDPLNDLVYDVHCYGDGDCSGTYKAAMAQDIDVSTNQPVHADTIVNRLRPAVEQSKREGKRLFVGEIGSPTGDAGRRDQVLRAARYLAANGVDWAYWCAGEWTGNDANSIQPGLVPTGAASLLQALPANR